MTASLHRIYALILRYIFLLRRSLPHHRYRALPRTAALGAFSGSTTGNCQPPEASAGVSERQ